MKIQEARFDITLRIQESLYKPFRRECARRGLSVTAAVKEAIELLMEKWGKEGGSQT